ncbi:ABC-F type ribosomal protection protein [Clostridium sediminicola]|uniref:ribosomal protection-like ABC-F family protein n=1 Tax=Clostridium sediminicola TaxID=3114879 RepID=UPI0031F26BAB
MIELALNEIVKYYGGNIILNGITFDIKTGERVGIIGQNGTGKTTLFKLISSIEKQDEGSINIRKGAKIGYLHQIPIYPDDYTVIDVLDTAFEVVLKLKREMETLEESMSSTDSYNLEKLMKKYSFLMEKFESLDGYNLEENINKICVGLKFNEEFKIKKFNLLSGGEKTTVLLGKILLEKADILLLDEPTNHLDIEAVEWLEDYMKEYKGTVLIISHDRYFLDRVVNNVIEIEKGRSISYLGNYSNYVKEKEENLIQQKLQYDQQQRKIKSMEEAIKRFRDWGTRGDDERFFKKARNMQKRIDNLDKVDKPDLQRKSMDLSFSESNRSGKVVVDISDLNKSFADKIILKDANLHLRYLDKVALLGKNGTGKSTLIKIIINEENDNVKIGSNVKIGYLQQEVSFDDENLSVLDGFRQSVIVPEGRARGILAKFLFFGEDVFKKIKNLSGGERSRLRLCELMHHDINFLILDEPTNHLDIDSREMLEEALGEFNGTILFVSHDRYFINKLASRVVELKNRKLMNYDGNYDYYKNELNKEEAINERVKVSKKKCKNKSSESNSYKQKKNNKNYDKDRLKRESKIEEEIYFIENKIKELEDKMLQYASDYSKLNELHQQKEERENELELLMEKWAEL